MYLNLPDLTSVLTDKSVPWMTRNAPFFFLHRWGEGPRDADWICSPNGKGLDDCCDCCEIAALAEVRRE